MWFIQLQIKFLISQTCNQTYGAVFCKCLEALGGVIEQQNWWENDSSHWTPELIYLNSSASLTDFRVKELLGLSSACILTWPPQRSEMDHALKGPPFFFFLPWIVQGIQMNSRWTDWTCKCKCSPQPVKFLPFTCFLLNISCPAIEETV